MARIHTIGGATAAAPSGGPTFDIIDRAGVKDAQTWAWSQGDSVGVKDAQTWAWSQGDRVGLADSLALTGTPLFADRVGLKDLLVVDSDEAALFRATGHGAAGDSDSWGDNWTDAAVGQTGVNHGDTDTLTISHALDATQRIGYIEIDLTRFTGFTSASGGVGLFTFRAAQSGVVAAATLSLFFNWVATRPFTESTQTQASPGSAGTNVTGVAVSVAPGGGFATYTAALTNAQLANFIGRWMRIQFQCDLLDTATFTVRGRSHATASERPNLHVRFAL